MAAETDPSSHATVSEDEARLSVEVAYDLFCPPESPVPMQAHYATMLEQAAYADEHGFDLVGFTEHHGVPENYLPAPLVAAAAVAARTRRARMRVVLLAPFYDPIRLAEDIAVLDLISNGRADPALVAGYVEGEFEMFGKRLADRRVATDTTLAFLRQAWTEDEAELDGRRVRVTPKPVQKPHPPIRLGGSSKIAALVAARLADDFYGGPKHREHYREECVRLGRPDPGPGPARASFFLHLAEDPERDWPQLVPCLLAAIGRYRTWTTAATRAGGPASLMYEIDDEAALRASGSYRVVTPDECLDLIRELGPHAAVTLRPGWGGSSPDLGWSSLELFVNRVLPQLRPVAASAVR